MNGNVDYGGLQKVWHFSPVDDPMDIANLSSPNDAVPHFAAVNAFGLERLIRKWLNRPSIEEITLVSFAFDPTFKFNDVPLFKKLELLALSAQVTVVTSDPRANRKRRFHPDNPRWLRIESLARCGVRILLHTELHAKVYLFREPNRVCWAVGSSNLTQGGLANNEEVNLRGYRYEDYSVVQERVEGIMKGAYPI
jgi:hypothetical protein